MKNPDRYPKITPLRAFELLRELDQKKSNTDATTFSGAAERTREALANHVKNALRRAGSR